MKITDEVLKKICEGLLRRDPDIIEIIQFGSSVYAPECARDIDLLVFTRVRRNYGVYLDATAEIYDEIGVPFNIDVVPSEAGKPLNESLALHVRGAFRVLHGDGSSLLEATNWAVKRLTQRLKINPTFEEARTSIKAAQDYIKLASSAENPSLRDRHVREAFDGLFHAARIASMAYLSTKETRWGRVMKRLPTSLKEEFGEIIATLHIKYFYEGNYPREAIEDEFDGWLKKVQEYIRKLESRVVTKR